MGEVFDALARAMSAANKAHTLDPDNIEGIDAAYDAYLAYEFGPNLRAIQRAAHRAEVNLGHLRKFRREVSAAV